MGEWLLRFTAWLSVLGWAGSEWLRCAPRPAPLAAGGARALFTASGLALAAHAALAFHVRHAWSQDAALRDTARQTLETVGLAVGAGLYVSYFFVLLWLCEIAWWWRSPTGYARRPRGLDRAVRGFFLLMLVNGAFLFVRGPARWIGALAAIVVLAAWYRRAVPEARRG